VPRISESVEASLRTFNESSMSLMIATFTFSTGIGVAVGSALGEGEGSALALPLPHAAVPRIIAAHSAAVTAVFKMFL